MFSILNMAINSWNGKIFCIFLRKKCSFTQNFAIQPYIFFVPKILRINFYPLKLPSQVKNSKLDKIPIFFGTPCSLWYISTMLFMWDVRFSSLFFCKLQITSACLTWQHDSLMSSCYQHQHREITNRKNDVLANEWFIFKNNSWCWAAGCNILIWAIKGEHLCGCYHGTGVKWCQYFCHSW